MWYFIDNNKQFGPVDESDIERKIRDDHFFRKTLVWQTGMESWQPAKSTSLNKLFLDDQSDPSAQLLSVDPKINRQTDELSNMFMWSWICLLLAFFTFGLGFTAAHVLWYIILFRCWELIQDGDARTTPVKAVGFLFIPLFTVYWNFVAYLGWAKDVNQYIAARDYPIKKLNTKIPAAMCILAVLSVIPFVNLLAGVPTLILMIIIMKQYTRTATQIINCKETCKPLVTDES